MKHFRDLSLEATVLENNNHSLETEASEAKTALQSARGKIDDLERQITERDCLIREYELQVCIFKKFLIIERFNTLTIIFRFLNYHKI